MALFRHCLLLVAGLLVLGSALPGELRAQRSPASGNEYGVKLCGREFIRAVIFTCGGSRWKRLSLAPAEEQVPDYLRRDDLQDSSVTDVKEQTLQTLLETKLEQLLKPDFPLQQQLLKDLFSVYNDISDYTLPAAEDFNEYIQQMKDTKGRIQHETQNSAAQGSDGLLWTVFPRRRRELSIGVAGICCKWGCTKSEISTLC